MVVVVVVGGGARTRTWTGTPTFPVKAHHAECCMMIILPSSNGIGPIKGGGIFYF